jgi:hypothetical protein
MFGFQRDEQSLFHRSKIEMAYFIFMAFPESVDFLSNISTKDLPEDGKISE